MNCEKHLTIDWLTVGYEINQLQSNTDKRSVSIIPAMNGGALESEFRLVQFHAHWGTTAGAKGSEHTVNGKLYDAEVCIEH